MATRVITRRRPPGIAGASGRLMAVVAGVAVATGVALGTGTALARDAGTAPRSVSPNTTTLTTPDTAAAPTSTAPPVTTTTTTAPAAPAATAQTARRIEPIIECTFLDPNTKLFSTVWGYQNQGPATTVPIGDLNRFDVPAAAPDKQPGDVGQPTAFAAGRRKNVFVVTAAGPSTWSLTDQKATTPGPACSTSPVPIVSTGPGGLVALAVVTGVMGMVLLWHTRRLRRP